MRLYLMWTLVNQALNKRKRYREKFVTERTHPRKHTPHTNTQLMSHGYLLRIAPIWGFRRMRMACMPRVTETDCSPAGRIVHPIEDNSNIGHLSLSTSHRCRWFDLLTRCIILFSVAPWYINIDQWPKNLDQAWNINHSCRYHKTPRAGSLAFCKCMQETIFCGHTCMQQLFLTSLLHQPVKNWWPVCPTDSLLSPTVRCIGELHQAHVWRTWLGRAWQIMCARIRFLWATSTAVTFIYHFHCWCYSTSMSLRQNMINSCECWAGHRRQRLEWSDCVLGCWLKFEIQIVKRQYKFYSFVCKGWWIA